MGTTPTYSLRYPSLDDAPDGATEGQSLATDVEAQLVRIDAATRRMGCQLQRAATQAAPDATFTAVSWDTRVLDTDNLSAAGTNINIPSDGIWSVSTTMFLGAVLTGIGVIVIKANGFEQCRYPIQPTGNTGSAALSMQLSAGTVITVEVFADTAAGTTMTGSVHCWRVSA
jgi:hypothetical protein